MRQASQTPRAIRSIDILLLALPEIGRPESDRIEIAAAPLAAGKTRSSIAALESEIEALKARQKAVEDLQSDRNLPVHLLNELVKQTPEGIYLTSIKQADRIVSITGVAQTNERVSEMLRNTAYSSEWLVKPDLVESKAMVAQAANKEQRQLFEFAMRLQVKRPQEAASMPGGAASGPAGAASAPAVSTPNKA